MRGKGGYDVMFSQSFVGGHLGKGRGRDNSEHARLLPECLLFQFLPKERNMRYNLRNTSISVPRTYTDGFKNVFSNNNF